MVTITAFSADQAAVALDDLAALLQNVVDAGASIGFHLPLSGDEARAYWRGIIADLHGPARILLVATVDGTLVGSIQLELAMRKNGLHRAEVQKLIVHTAARSQGIGRALLAASEETARASGRTLLVLDTREGDVAGSLYRSHGYTEVGVIPRYVRNERGDLEGTIVFYKDLSISDE